MSSNPPKTVPKAADTCMSMETTAPSCVGIQALWTYPKTTGSAVRGSSRPKTSETRTRRLSTSISDRSKDAPPASPSPPPGADNPDLNQNRHRALNIGNAEMMYCVNCGRKRLLNRLRPPSTTQASATSIAPWRALVARSASPHHSNRMGQRRRVSMASTAPRCAEPENVTAAAREASESIAATPTHAPTCRVMRNSGRLP